MKVGDYLRTKKGIEKITYLRESMTLGGYEKYMTTDKKAYETLTDFAGIIKSSPNIIDLIEVGDYVNGCLVSEIKDKWLILNYADIETYEQLERKNENINSIVTKEQFESVEYEVGVDKE